MPGDKPRFKLKVKPRAPGAKRLTIASVWQNDKGMTAKLDRDVKEVVMRDGTVWTNDNAYFDLFDEQDGRRSGGSGARPSEPEAPVACNHGVVGACTDCLGDIPF